MKLESAKKTTRQCTSAFRFKKIGWNVWMPIGEKLETWHHLPRWYSRLGPSDWTKKHLKAFKSCRKDIKWVTYCQWTAGFIRFSEQITIPQNGGSQISFGDIIFSQKKSIDKVNSWRWRKHLWETQILGKKLARILMLNGCVFLKTETHWTMDVVFFSKTGA